MTVRPASTGFNRITEVTRSRGITHRITNYKCSFCRRPVDHSSSSRHRLIALYTCSVWTILTNRKEFQRIIIIMMNTQTEKRGVLRSRAPCPPISDVCVADKRLNEWVACIIMLRMERGRARRRGKWYTQNSVGCPCFYSTAVKDKRSKK